MPDPTKPISFQRKLLLLLIPALSSALCLYLLWSTHPDPEYWYALWKDGLNYLKAHPSALILSMAILPGLGFPISPLLILFGAVLGPVYGLFYTCIIGILAQAFCSVWTYYLSIGPLRGLLQALVLRDRPLPPLNQQNAWRLCAIIRITPGIPYALQNVALGVMGTPLKIYLAVSIPIQSLYSIGFMVGGGAIFKGNLGLAITAAVFFIAVLLAARMFQKRNRRTC